ncbi:hypothetical protein ACIA8I_39810 [Streptomyces rishiriensis]|uniref:hypothetical protein n=1 Tax=Streptomyces rishiriensis TaxID=68264 RepID=UPI00379F40B1
MGASAWDTETKRPIYVDLGVEGLPIGLAGGRYLCRACADPLILRGARPEAKVTPHFSHQEGGPCRLAEREAQIDADDQVVIQLSHQIRALPGITGCTLASPGDDPRDPIGLPPVVIAQCGDTAVVIERPGTLPSPQAVRRRILAVREHHAGAAHVWFLRRDPGQFGQLPSHKVRLSGRDVEHQRVAPTEQQLAILDAGGHVYWLDGKLVLVPYGYHAFRHPARPEQDWTAWPKWPRHKDPRDDWRISKPRPAPTADCWGLVPIALSSLTRTRAVFHPADAHKVMDELYAAQEGRHRWRDRRAREVYAERHAPPTPQPAAPIPTAEAPATEAETDQHTAPQLPQPADQRAAEAPPRGNVTPSVASSANLAPAFPPPPVAPPTIPPPPQLPPAPPAPRAPRQRRWVDTLRMLRRRRER